MNTRLRFDLPTVLQLAEHAIAAASHLDTAGMPTDDVGPALHLDGDWWGSGIYLASNANPGLPLGDNDCSGYLVAEPDGYGAGVHWMHWMDWIEAVLGTRLLSEVFPLTDPRGGRLIDLLRRGGAAGFDTFLIDVADIGLTTAVARRRKR